MGAVRPVGALVALLGVTLVASCTNPDPAARPRINDTPQLAARWSVSLADSYGQIELAQVIDQHIVVAFERGVAVLDRATGKQRWSTAADFPTLPQQGQGVRVTPDAVVVLNRTGTGASDPGTASAYHIATGKELASRAYDAADGQVAVVGDTMLVKYQDGGTQSKTYVLEAVDLKTGRELWKHTYDTFHPLIWQGPHEQRATHVSTRDPLLAPGSTLVLLRGYEKVRDAKRGDDLAIRLRVVDARTGRTVGGPYAAPDHRSMVLLDDDRYALWDDDPAPGCETQVTGYGVGDGKQAWQLTAALWRYGHRKTDCAPYWRPLVLEGRLLTYTPDEKPVVVESATGTATWTGPEGFYPIGLGGDVLVGRDSRAGGGVTAYDFTSGKRLWGMSAKDAPPQLTLSEYDAVAGDYAILSTGYQQVTLYRLGTGEQRRCAGDNELLGAGDGWLLTGLHGIADEKPQLRYFDL
ncbi:MAG: PQQ-binding-like beta-propeller repeat protein [Micromonosporaceae bacterium]